MKLWTRSRPLAGLLFVAFVAPAWAEQPPATKKADTSKTLKYLRIKKDNNGQPAALQTAVVRFVPASGTSGVTVDLIAAVHVGERGYYERLNDLFEQYDVMLYELVAPPGTRIPKGGRKNNDNPLAIAQQVMKTVLDLELQTEQVDYTAKNFVHADLSPDQIAERIRKRGDSGLTLILSIAADLLREQNLRELEEEAKPNKAAADDEDDDVFSLLLSPEGPSKLKRMMAEQFEKLSTPTGGLGKTLNTILIADRNEAAAKTLRKELDRGKKKIAIFYGAAHMPDFERRLKEDFGLKREGEQWLTAWDLKIKKRSIFDLLKLLDE